VKQWLAGFLKVCWALFLVALPVTSFPFFPPVIGGGALVRPLSIYPLIPLFILATLPILFTRPLPRTLISLVPFVVLALASSVLAFLRGIDPVMGVTVSERMLRAVLTLGLGSAIYLTVALLPRTLKDLQFALRWLYTGFGIAMLIASLQAIYVIHFNDAWFSWMSRLQQYISIRRLIFNRISGPTYEPNWFAEQLTFLLFPWLLAAVLSGYTVFRWRWRWLTGELILLLWGIILLPFTYSRAGLINLVALVGLSILFFRFQPGRHTSPRKPLLNRRLRVLVEILVVVVVLGGLVYGAGTRNEFFARIWGYWVNKKEPTLSGYLNYLGFGARLTYGETAYRIYKNFPGMGVGLGNYALYFDEMLEERPLAYTPEVLRHVTLDEGRNRLITSKNLYLRLLAETGVAGTAAFIGFVLAIAGCALYLKLSKDPEHHFWGVASLLGVLAFLLSAFSFDSFAIPNMWVVFGLITSATWILRREQEPVESPASELVPAQAAG
jgi:hypothetical protein